MLVGGSLAMLTMAGAGGMITNYGWREAQHEEIDAAMRASVSATARHMRGGVAGAEQDIKERVAGFMRGLLGNLTISDDDVVVVHDASTNRTTIQLAGDAAYAFHNLWPPGSGGQTPSPLTGKAVIVEFEATVFEFALALDVTSSMGSTINGSVTRMDALKKAVKAIAHKVDDASKTNPGIVAVSLVPFGNVVNVADTSGTARTDAKERYVRMLTGAAYSTNASRNTEGHWVDTFHSYGTGNDMGPLASRDLPDFLSAADWNLHAPGTEDVSSQAPAVGTWSFEGEDFWNGCVMARWGAYWDTDARPGTWAPSDTSNWPARKTVNGWEPGSSSIAGLPLHLSDAPPDAGDPNTRFTAYSWPDARINGFADGMLADVLQVTLNPGFDPRRTIPWTRGYGQHMLPASANHWHLRAQDRGGSLYCPEAPIVPLTDDLTALQAADQYDYVNWHSTTRWTQTFLHLGIVWGLRTLSPLWRDVWNTTSASGDALPRTPCLEGGTTQGCSQFVDKTILIISDGENFFGSPGRGRHSGRYDPDSAVTANPVFWPAGCHFYLCRSHGGVCTHFRNHFNGFRTAMFAEDPGTFEASFDVDANGVFSLTGLSSVLDSFQKLHPTVSALDPTDALDNVAIVAYRLLWRNALKDMTPWQLFRGYDSTSPTRTTDAADVLTNPANRFGFKGRPAHNGHFCRPSTPFSAYGRADDLVRIGDGPPVSDAAPFSVSTWRASSSTADLKAPITERLNGWFQQACDLAGERGVRIEAIYIGGDTEPWEKQAIAVLEDCVDRSRGGNPLRDEVHITPTEGELGDAMDRIIDIRRALRFVGS